MGYGKVLACNCTQIVPAGAKSQDAYYGPGKRYHNETRKGGQGDTIFKCTVCGSTKNRTGVAASGGMAAPLAAGRAVA